VHGWNLSFSIAGQGKKLTNTYRKVA
jgi:hypothetical protein